MIKTLVRGYERKENGKMLASSSVVLIQENGINIIIDPGMDRKKLLKGLNEVGLSKDEMDYVILTHYHLDHSLLAGIFKEAKVLDDGIIYSFDGRMEEHEKKVPGTPVKIIKTPGHANFHCSVLVETEKEKVVIAGDVWFWKDEEEQKIDKKSLMEHEDPYVKDEEKLKESRKKLLNLADRIIPGHGKEFRIETLNV